MNTTPDVSLLDRELNMERVAFHAIRRSLANDLRPFQPPQQAEDHIISYAEEFGVEHTLGTLATEPATFGLNAPAGSAGLLALKDKVQALHASREAMDQIVSKREDILAKADPKRDRVYISFGREFTIDMANRRVRYVDTGKVEPLVLEEVAPSGEPAKAQSKQRDREK